MRKLLSMKEDENKQYVEFMIVLDGIEQQVINDLEQKMDDLERNSNLRLYGVENIIFSPYYEYWDKWWKSHNDDFLHECSEKFEIIQDDDIKRMFNFYIIKLNKKTYKLNYGYEIKNETSILLYFEIASEIKNEEIDEYDKELEGIKLFVKEAWIKKVKKRGRGCNYKVVWLEDTQSLMLSNSCYLKINLVENLLRKLINQIMIYRCGLNWREILLNSKIENKYLGRTGNYKQLVQGFQNVDDFLLSLDADDLTTIMNYEQEFIDMRDLSIEFNKLENKVGEEDKSYPNAKKIENLFDKLLKNSKRKSKSIWEIYFSDLFDVKNRYERYGEKSPNIIESKFREDWQKLCQYRNHVAHNKFIDYDFYKKLLNQIENISSQIFEAEKEYQLQLDDMENTIGYSDPLTGEHCDPKELVYRRDREMRIYNQVSWFVNDIIKTLSEQKEVSIQVKEGFRYFSYELKDEIDSEFIKFVESFKSKNEPVVVINARKNNDAKLQMGKCKNELTTYYVKFVVNDEVVFITEISHNGYEFCCEGIEEEHPFVGGFWSDFRRKVISELEELFKESEPNNSKVCLLLDELGKMEVN